MTPLLSTVVRNEIHEIVSSIATYRPLWCKINLSRASLLQVLGPTFCHCRSPLPVLNSLMHNVQRHIQPFFRNMHWTLFSMTLNDCDTTLTCLWQWNGALMVPEQSLSRFPLLKNQYHKDPQGSCDVGYSYYTHLYPLYSIVVSFIMQRFKCLRCHVKSLTVFWPWQCASALSCLS